MCQFCHLDMAAAGHEAHEKYCGSRTEKCPECSDFVMLKDWDEHQKMTLYHGRGNLKHTANANMVLIIT
jgi:hypothetical protein